MTYLVGYRKLDKTIGIARIGEVESFEEARQAVIEQLGVKTVLALVQGF